MIQTYSSAEAAEQIGCSERWMVDQLRAKRFRGRKVGRHWRLTDQDITDNLDLCLNEAPRPMPLADENNVFAFSSLMPTSRKRMVAEDTASSPPKHTGHSGSRMQARSTNG